jgi:glycosyltransferase involved in cell wall biosynthesis
MCIIALNEEANIGACIRSAADLCDEVVVLDTGSTDRTKEVARAHGAKVFDFTWVDDFAAARNACLDHATGDFIFWLDADDRLDEPNRAKLRQLFATLTERNVAFSMKCLCLSAPGQQRSVVDHVRLFRRDPLHRWRYKIHEQILGSLRASGAQVLPADVVITHTGYTDPVLRQQKLQRDLRLLEKEYAEQPHDPFTLFNLGQTLAELRHFDRALALLQESLSRSHPSDSIVRKLFVLIANCHLGLNQHELALQTCLQGQAVCPDDAELLFLDSRLRSDRGDLHGAKTALVRLLSGSDSAQFASVVAGLRSYRGRHHLAHVCLRLGQHDEAEAHWRDILRQHPDFLPASLGLGDVFLARGRWPELDDLANRLAADSAAEVDAVVLRARAHRARQELVPARQLLEQARQRWPDSFALLLQYSYVLLAQDSDHLLADRVLSEILERDPGNSEALNNRRVLHQRAGWHVP